MNWYKLEKKLFKLLGIEAKNCKYYRHEEQCCNSEYCWNGMCNDGISGKERLPISRFLIYLNSKKQLWINQLTRKKRK